MRREERENLFAIPFVQSLKSPGGCCAGELDFLGAETGGGAGVRELHFYPTTEKGQDEMTQASIPLHQATSKGLCTAQDKSMFFSKVLP